MEKQEKNKTEQNPMPPWHDSGSCKGGHDQNQWLHCNQKYGLPASLLDVILTGVLSEVREMKCMEYRQLKEGEKDGKCHNVSE